MRDDDGLNTVRGTLYGLLVSPILWGLLLWALRCICHR